MLGVLVGVMVGSVSLAGAVEPAADPAEAMIQRGVKLRKAGDDQGALAEFQKAYDLAHTPRAACQIGLAEQALGRWEDAERHLAECLRAAADAWVEKNRSTLKESIGRVAYEAGVMSYRRGAYDHALDLFREAHDSIGKPELLFNIADCEERLGRLAAAVELLRRYLVEKPAASDRGEIEARIQSLEKRAGVTPPASAAAAVAPPPGTVASSSTAPAAEAQNGAPPSADKLPTPPAAPVLAVAEKPAPASAPSAPSRRSVRPLVGWVATGVGGVTAVVGLVVALLGQSSMNDAIDQADQANTTLDEGLYMSASARFSDGRSERTTGRILLAAGGVVAVAGLALALTTPRQDTGATVGHLEPWLGTSHGQLAAGGLLWSARW